MRKWVMQIHQYIGLLFFGFLLLFATSALLFNHAHDYLENVPYHSKSEHTIKTQPQEDASAYAAAVRDELGITGRLLPATVSKGNGLSFSVARPGRRYSVHVNGATATIDEARQGWIATLVGMHGVRNTTNSLVLNAWAWYAALGAIVLALNAISGVYLWAILRRERVLGWSVITLASALSLFICFYVRNKG